MLKTLSLIGGLIAATLGAGAASAQVTLNTPEAWGGLTLFQPIPSTTAYFMDVDGTIVHEWPGTFRSAISVYLRENGNLLRTIKTGTTSVGGAGGGVQEVAWDGTVVWDFRYSSAAHLSHHDIEGLPNGNVLMIAWEYLPTADAVAAGRNPAYLSGTTFAPDHIIEVQPTGPTSGTIVWEWHVWDHLIQDHDATKANHGVVADHPELIDLNYPPQVAGGGDWNHLNSIDYNADLDQIVVSSRTACEFWVIDHSTSTAEAAGHTGGNSGRGGDLLYRWGNPEAYRAGTVADKQLYAQHDVQWIEPGLPGAGNLLLFNNGKNRPAGNYSSVDEVAPPVDAQGNYALTPGAAYGPAQALWTYTAPNPTDFYSAALSGAERQPNGNTLICSGTQGWLFEVNAASAMVWEFLNTYPSGVQSKIFKVRRYRPCLQPTTYCAAAPNSNGTGALIGWTGSASLAANDLVLTATGAASNQPGIFYCGTTQIQVPFGDGDRCAGGSVLRLPVVFTDSGGSVSYALDFTDASLDSIWISEWDSWNFQFWFRDGAFGGAGFNFSDALNVRFCQ